MIVNPDKDLVMFYFTIGTKRKTKKNLRDVFVEEASSFFNEVYDLGGISTHKDFMRCFVLKTAKQRKSLAQVTRERKWRPNARA